MSGARSTASAIGLPPAEAIRWFAQKVNLPTRRWDDIWTEQHAHAFMVAGAASQALLGDFRAEITRALEQGTTLADFRKAFDEIVARHGWSHTGTPGWRAQIIYETNLAMSYSAGRWSQMTEPETLALYPYWQYVHSGAEHPRLQHLAWNGLTLRADDPFWKTHYPPNGWRCGCRVRPLSARELARQGKGGPDRAPRVEMVPYRRSNGRVEMVPRGIDPGFGYNPGEAQRQYQDVIPADAVLRPPPAWPPPPPAIASGGGPPAPPAPGAVKPPAVAAAPTRRALPPPLDVPPIGQEAFGAWLTRAAATERVPPVPLGRVPARALGTGVAPTVVLTATNLRRIAGKEARTGQPIGLAPEDIARLPALVASPIAVLRQRDNGNLVLVFRPLDPRETRLGKLVLIPNGQVRLPRAGGGRIAVSAALLRSAGLVQRDNLADTNRYELIEGGL